MEQDLSERYKALYLGFTKLVPLEAMDPADGFETPKEGALYHSAYEVQGYDLTVGVDGNMDQLDKNDELLVQYLGLWSLDKFHVHRRYSAVYEGPAEGYHALKKIVADGYSHVSSEYRPHVKRIICGVSSISCHRNTVVRI